MSEWDIDALLRRLDPAANLVLPEADGPLGTAIRARALERPGRTPRRLVPLIAAVLVLVITASATALFVWSDEPAQPALICFSAADLDADRVELPADRLDDLTGCRALWQDGTFSADGVVPPLVACVVDGGGVGVFPGPAATCAELNLPVAVGLTTLAPAIELAERLTDIAPPEMCRPHAEAAAAARELLDETGLAADGWTVRRAGEPTDDRPCGSFGLDGPAKRVILVPIPRPAGG